MKTRSLSTTSHVHREPSAGSGHGSHDSHVSTPSPSLAHKAPRTAGVATRICSPDAGWGHVKFAKAMRSSQSPL